MSRRKHYNPVVPRNYDELSECGQRGVDRHLAPDIDFELQEIRTDGRLNVLWIIAEHGSVDNKTFNRLTRERRTMKQ